MPIRNGSLGSNRSERYGRRLARVLDDHVLHEHPFCRTWNPHGRDHGRGRDHAFELTDRINLSVFAPSGLTEAFRRFKDYICAEILADDLQFESSSQAQEIEINGENLTVTVNKKG